MQHALPLALNHLLFRRFRLVTNAIEILCDDGIDRRVQLFDAGNTGLGQLHRRQLPPGDAAGGLKGG